MLILFWLTSLVPVTDGTTAETVLINQLFTYYDKRIRPTIGFNTTVVTTTLAYFILLVMEQEQEYIQFSADIQLSWNDPIIMWTPSEENSYTTQLFLKETDVWRPDIAVVNSLSQTEVIAENSRLAEIEADGTVSTSDPSVYQTWCVLDINDFPFDVQECSINIGSWVYTANETLIVTPETEFNLSDPNAQYEGNSEWDVTRVWAEIVPDSTNGEAFQDVRYYIRLKRRAAYYVFVLFIPTFIVSTLCILGLFTPLDNFGNRAERATLGLTTLLSLSVILNLVGSDMPKQTRLPRLAQYVLAEIVVCSVGVLITIVIQLAHQRVNTRQILPSKKKMLERFPHTEPDRLGVRVLKTSDGRRSTTHIMDDIDKSLRDINAFIDRMNQKEEFLLYWVKVFDRCDLVFLFILQAANIILTIVYLTY